MIETSHKTLAASLLGGAARVVLGVLWILEGSLKLHAGFGASDILLVVDSTAHNSRVPDYFALISAPMRAFSALFGFGIPLLELAIGILLVLGVFTRITAVAAALLLALYWSSDQLTGSYPVMLVLAALVLAIPQSGALSVRRACRGARVRIGQRPRLAS